MGGDVKYILSGATKCRISKHENPTTRNTDLVIIIILIAGLIAGPPLIDTDQTLFFLHTDGCIYSKENSSDLSMGRRPTSKSVEFFMPIIVIVEL